MSTKGKHWKHSEEAKRNMSLAHKGKLSWMKNKTYEELYGKVRAELLKLKLSKSHKGQRKGQTYEQIYGIEKANELKAKQRKAKLSTKIPLEKRWKLTDENRRNQSLAKKGKVSLLKGKTYKQIYGGEKQALIEIKKRITTEKIRKTTAKLMGHKCSEGAKKKISEAIKGEKNYMFGKHHTEEVKRKIGKGNEGKIVSKEAREQMSKTKSRLIKEGKINLVTHGKQGYYYSRKNKKKLWYRSSYELQAYKILEQLSKIAKYKNEPFYIPYKFQGIEKNYVPDILITYDDNSQELIEVMPAYQLADSIRVAKFQSARKYCKKNNIIFSIWSEKELFNAEH